jgi:formylglycine-generating enzyme required for sulfatase activity
MKNNGNPLGLLFTVMIALCFILSSCTPKLIPPVVPSLTLPPLSTESPTATFTPAPGIGSTWTRPADGMTMVYVPEGNFSMGGTLTDDEKPVHTVYLDAYWIDRTEVTNAMYAQCEQAGACQPPNVSSSHTRASYYGNPQYANYPVVHVDWEQAQAYCEWAGARLPTEAEWEKAASKGDGYLYPWGNSLPSDFLLNSNFRVNDTTAVGSYPPGASPYGALDMAGNVEEWVADWYSDTYYASSPSSNPPGPSTGIYRVERGGAWDSEDIIVRSSFRGFGNPSVAIDQQGFRCAHPGETSVAVATHTPIPTQTPNPLHPTLADFFLRCPTAAEIADVNTRLKITFENDPTAGTLACTAAAGSADLDPLQKKAYQTIVILKYLQFDQPLPWTSKQLYDWFTGAVKGVNFKYAPGDSSCCLNGIVQILVHDNSFILTQNVWVDGQGDPGPYGDMGAGLLDTTGVYIHEARHNEGNGHPHLCPGSKDLTLADMGAWSIQYYYFYWLAYHSDRDFLLAPGFNPNMYRQAAIFDANLILGNEFCNDKFVTPVPYPTISNPFPTTAP